MFLVSLKILILSRTGEQVDCSAARVHVLTMVLKKKKKEEEEEEEEEE